MDARLGFVAGEEVVQIVVPFRCADLSSKRVKLPLRAGVSECFSILTNEGERDNWSKSESDSRSRVTKENMAIDQSEHMHV